MGKNILAVGAWGFAIAGLMFVFTAKPDLQTQAKATQTTTTLNPAASCAARPATTQTQPKVTLPPPEFPATPEVRANKPIRRGGKGSAVAALQKVLGAFQTPDGQPLYAGEADGNFGKQTERAWRDVQAHLREKGVRLPRYGVYTGAWKKELDKYILLVGQNSEAPVIERRDHVLQPVNQPAKGEKSAPPAAPSKKGKKRRGPSAPNVRPTTPVADNRVPYGPEPAPASPAAPELPKREPPKVGSTDWVISANAPAEIQKRYQRVLALAEEYRQTTERVRGGLELQYKMLEFRAWLEAREKRAAGQLLATPNLWPDWPALLNEESARLSGRLGLPDQANAVNQAEVDYLATCAKFGIACAPLNLHPSAWVQVREKK